MPWTRPARKAPSGTTPLRTLLLLCLMVVGTAAASAASDHVAALGGVAAAASQGSSAAPADEALGPVDVLAAADRLTLRFRGYPELTGDYRVSPDAFISVPVVGRLSTAGLDLAGLEKALSTKLSQIVQKESFVTAEIAAYRPVFVTGAVRTPGGVEWRPGLTVLQAIVLAGGMAAEVPGSLAPGAPASGGPALLKAVEGRKRDLAVIARLEAEQRDLPAIAVPEDLVSLVGANEAEQLIAHETEVLKNSLEVVAAKLETLQRGIAAGDAEMASLQTQINKLNAQLALRIDYRNKVKDLFSKGIITAERNMEEEIKVTDLEEKITNIQVGLAKSAGTVAELQLAAVSLKRDRAGAIEAELARVQRNSAELAIEIGAARRRPEAIAQPASDKAREDAGPALQIVRRQTSGSVTFDADRGTLMRPGDVLIVGRP